MSASFLPALPHMLEECERLGFVCSDDSVENVLSSVITASFFLGGMLGPVLGGALLMFLNFQQLVEAVGLFGAVLAGVYLLASPKPWKAAEE